MASQVWFRPRLCGYEGCGVMSRVLFSGTKGMSLSARYTAPYSLSCSLSLVISLNEYGGGGC